MASCQGLIAPLAIMVIPQSCAIGLVTLTARAGLAAGAGLVSSADTDGKGNSIMLLASNNAEIKRGVRNVFFILMTAGQLIGVNLK